MHAFADEESALAAVREDSFDVGDERAPGMPGDDRRIIALSELVGFAPVLLQ